MTADAIAGALIATAYGDALGLPYENLSRARAQRLLGPPSRHRLLFGHGMVSDDTDHACMTLVALARSGADPGRFADALGWQLRWWLLALPAGIGWATLRGCVRLWLGLGPGRSGVNSAGNGPAMRSAVLGAAIDDPGLLRRLVEHCAHITHTDPRALDGALIVAFAARHARLGGGLQAQAFSDLLRREGLPRDPAFASALAQVEASIAVQQSSTDFARDLGLQRGVSGFMVHTVAVALHCWLRHPQDVQAAVRSAIECGGDTDSVAAIAAGIVGSGLGARQLPPQLLAAVLLWPGSGNRITQLADAAAGAVQQRRAVSTRGWLAAGTLPRNLLQLAVLLVHSLRRLAPPYS